MPTKKKRGLQKMFTVDAKALDVVFKAPKMQKVASGKKTKTLDEEDEDDD